MFHITGTLVEKFDTNEVAIDKHYRTFWLRTHENNPQVLRMQLSGLDCVRLDVIDQGDMVTVDFYISGRPKMKGNKQELYNNLNVKYINKM
jgi:hypothetical protein